MNAPRQPGPPTAPQTELAIAPDDFDPVQAFMAHDPSPPAQIAGAAFLSFITLPALVLFPVIKPFVVAAFVFFAVSVVRRHVLMRRAAMAATAIDRAAPYRVQWDDAAITITRGDEANTFRWDEVADWDEGQKLFILYPPGPSVAKGGFVTLPKRCFHEGPSIGAFRKLLREKLPEGKIAPARSARRQVWMMRMVFDLALAIAIAAFILLVL